MQCKYFTKATDLAKWIIEKKIKVGSVVVDATVGNGHDTFYLAEKVGKEGKVYGFDIQDSALLNTKKRLVNNNVFDRVELIKDSHEKLDAYVKEKVDLVIFNLGYLPGGDHSIVTKPESTIKAIEKSLLALKKYGILLVVAYYGHKGGKEEKEKVENYLRNLDQKQFNVLKFDFINQINNPPILFGVEKKG
ncbi:tRNA (mnm(5)s(2)U34)-methyltransferase [Thermohalobacter berrensis]|uniref:16S rRNA (Cytosine(1402)-N(4))-methyltransferase n=1 Tax=Thermohalobacter berrensis TaxID=99594 RepID=A0A419TAN6_9FIRM|nr:class I SAM-dependent methyltransferase [Thermohalobacter berrensis]RKD34535.1 16S rRNA (cytosine(1402)-N(4))-methyltransferase [Thermohalobacter berrensis]